MHLSHVLALLISIAVVYSDVTSRYCQPCWAWQQRTHGCLVGALFCSQQLCMDPSPLYYAAHAWCEAIIPVVVDFPHAWVAWSQEVATNAGQRHGHRQNAWCALVNSTSFFPFFWVLAHGSYRVIAVSLCLLTQIRDFLSTPLALLGFG